MPPLYPTCDLIIAPDLTNNGIILHGKSAPIYGGSGGETAEGGLYGKITLKTN